jgi:GNAT superfamily N-acetyltransferase
MMNSITIKTVEEDSEVQGILDLQQQNLRKKLSQEIIESQGFVTVEHEYPVLKAMNDAQPSVIAKDGKRVVGYCLAMLPQFRDDIPILSGLFDTIDKIEFDGKLLKIHSYFVMGQVCVDEGYRGIGLFDKMYEHLRASLSDKFELCVTDISSKNTRSQKAHGRVGFKAIHEFYEEALDESWIVVLWDWRKKT